MSQITFITVIIVSSENQANPWGETSWQWLRGGPGGPGFPLFSDQTEAQRPEKSFLETEPHPPSYHKVWIRHCLPSKTLVSVLHKEPKYKVERLKYTKLQVLQPRIKNKPQPGSVHTKFYSRDWLIQSIEE